MADPFGQALLDHFHERRDEPLIQRDGEETLEHPIEQFYFTPFDAEADTNEWVASKLQGPLLSRGSR